MKQGACLLLFALSQIVLGDIDSERLQFNRRLKGSVMKYLTHASLRQCLKECESRASCLALNYASLAKLCELNFLRDGMFGAVMTKVSNSIYWEKHQFSYIDVPCGGISCQTGLVCVKETNTTHCAYRECAPIRASFGLHVFGNIRDIWSKARVECQMETITYKVKHVTCTETGVWSPDSVSCTNDWIPYGIHEYKITTDSLDWDSARVMCQSLSADLVNVEDANEHNLLRDLCRHHGKVRYWTGAKREPQLPYKWTDGSTMQFHVNYDNGDCVFLVDNVNVPNYDFSAGYACTLTIPSICKRIKK